MRFSQIFLKMKYSAVVKIYKVVRCDANDDRPLLMPDISECITGMIKYRKKCGRLMFTRLELRPRMYFL